MAKLQGENVDTQSSTSDPGAPARVAVSIGRSALGWGVLWVVLIGLADIDTTAELASAFAWLIFVAVLLLYGPTAFANISTLTQGS